jgi:hypothetical protein
MTIKSYRVSGVRLGRERDDDQELSGSEGLAEGGGSCRRLLSPLPPITTLRNVRSLEPNAAIGGIHPGKHCGGTREGASRRLLASPLDGKRFFDGTGDSSLDLRPPDVLQFRRSEAGIPPNCGGWANAEWPDLQASGLETVFVPDTRHLTPDTCISPDT